MIASTSDKEFSVSRRHERILEGENEVLKLIIERAPLPSILEAIVRVAERQSETGLLASILLLDRDGVHLRHGAAPTLPPAYCDAINGIAIGPEVGSCGTAAHTRKLVVVTDIAQDPLWDDFRDLALRHGLRACWSSPILSRSSSVLGTFALYYHHPCAPEPADESMISILTRTAALAIEHHRAEDELAESEERFRSLSRCAPLGVFTTDAAGVFTYVNPKFVQTAGYEYEKTIDYWLEAAGADAAVVADWARSRDARLGFDRELVLSAHGGRPVSLRMAPMRSGAGNHLGYVGTIEDISARLEGDAKLLHESRMRSAIETSIPAGIAAISSDGTQTYVNRAFASMVGWPADELIGRHAPFPYWPEDQTPAIQQALSATLAGNAPREGFELRFQRKDGQRFDASVNIAPLHRDGGEASGWVAAISNITERKRSEQNLARSEARLAMALEAGRMAAWEFDIESGRVSWSPQLEAIHGLEPGTFGGRFEDFKADILPDHLPRVLDTIQAALRDKSDYRVEYPILRPDGSTVTVEARGRVLCNGSGEPAKMVGVCMIVTRP